VTAKKPDSELERRAEVVIPLTGELIALADPEQVAEALERLQEAKKQLDDVRSVLMDALRLEAERQGTKTLHLDGFKAVVSGGEKVEYDTLELADELRKLGLPEHRIGELIVETVNYRVDRRVAKSVATNPRYAEALERHSQVVPAPWRVTVEREDYF